MNCPSCSSPMEKTCLFCGYHISYTPIVKGPDTIKSLVGDLRELLAIIYKRDLCESTNCHKCPLTKRSLASAEKMIERALMPNNTWTIDNLQAMKRNLEADIPSMAHRY